MQQALTIIATALLSSALTVGLFWWLYQRRLKAEIDAQLQAAIAQVDGQLQSALEVLGDIVEERVKQGLVRGVAAIPTSEVLTDATRSAAKTGAELAAKGLAALLGIKPRRPEE